MNTNYLGLDTEAPWEPGATYHVYNRAVALNLLYVDQQDHRKFRDKMIRLRPYCEIYAYICCGNHFHMHLRIRSEAAIRQRLERLPELLKAQQKYLEGRIGFQRLVGDAFARTVQAYARAFNLRHGRSGDLFNKTVKRIAVTDRLLSRRLVAYIHCNAFKHQIADTVFGLGVQSSFGDILRGESYLIAVDAVLERFGGMDTFVAYHREFKERWAKVLNRFNEERYFAYKKVGLELHRGKVRPPWLLDRGEQFLQR